MWWVGPLETLFEEAVIVVGEATTVVLTLLTLAFLASFLRYRVKERQRCEATLRQTAYCRSHKIKVNYAVQATRLIAALRLVTLQRVRPITALDLRCEAENLLQENLDDEEVFDALLYCAQHGLLKPTGRGVKRFRLGRPPSTKLLRAQTEFEKARIS